MLIIFPFFFNEPATTEIYTLSLHDALPIYQPQHEACDRCPSEPAPSGGEALLERVFRSHPYVAVAQRSEEHTSELQSQFHLVCRLLLEKKKKTIRTLFIS